MRLGAGFPSLDVGGDPVAVRHWTESVEALGFHHILTYEHVIGFDGYDHRSAFGALDSRSIFHEPLVLFGFLAAVTTRVELVTGVLVLPQRQTALVAKQAAEVDVLSGGRLRLGIGVGWIPEEFDVLNEPFRNRGRRSEEQIAVLRAVWTEQPSDFTGEWHRFERAGISPRPVQRPIPIWIGTHSDAGLARVGRLADGWMTFMHPLDNADALRHMLDQIHASARQAGRDPAEIGIDPHVGFNRVPESGWVEYASAWQSLGATHLTVTTMGIGTSSVDEHLAALRHVRDELAGAGLLERVDS